MFANAEFRFPLIDAALTPIGVIGGIRGVFFANIGGGWFNNQAVQVRHVARRNGHADDRLSDRTPPATSSPTRAATRFRSTARHKPSAGSACKDGRASYGLGLETFALGFPIHFDWSWRTLLQQELGGSGLRVGWRQFRIPQAAIRGLDRIRLLG